jgi:hypothetical protein
VTYFYIKLGITTELSKYPYFLALGLNHESEVSIKAYPDLKVGGAKAGLISEPTLYL